MESRVLLPGAGAGNPLDPDAALEQRRQERMADLEARIAGLEGTGEYPTDSYDVTGTFDTTYSTSWVCDGGWGLTGGSVDIVVPAARPFIIARAKADFNHTGESNGIYTYAGVEVALWDQQANVGVLWSYFTINATWSSNNESNWLIYNAVPGPHRLVLCARTKTANGAAAFIGARHLEAKVF